MSLIYLSQLIYYYELTIMNRTIKFNSKIWLISSVLFLISSCATSRFTPAKFSKRYMSSVEAKPGLETYQTFRRRVIKNRSYRKIIYKTKNKEALMCAFLRNQLYAAALHSSKKKITETAKLMERAYQASNKDWFRECSRLKQTSLGKSFIKAQTKF